MTQLTAEQDRALDMLKAHGVVTMSSIKSVVMLNAMRDLTKRNLARFGRWPTSDGNVLVGYALVFSGRIARVVA